MLDRLRDVFKSLNAHEVRYLVIGGVAAVLHGIPRATFDLDILIEATEENAQRLLDALDEAGLGTASLISAQGLLANQITVFQDWVRIDVQTSTPGLSFDTAWARRQLMNPRGQEFYVVSKEDLIAAKLAAGRAIDRDEVRLLQQGKQGSQS